MKEEMALKLIEVGERFIVPIAITALATAATVYLVYMILNESQLPIIKKMQEEIDYLKAKVKRLEKQRDDAHMKRIEDANEMVAMDDQNRTMTLRIAQAESRAEQIAKAKDKNRKAA